jgi:hypothetical protein
MRTGRRGKVAINPLHGRLAKRGDFGQQSLDNRGLSIISVNENCQFEGWFICFEFCDDFWRDSQDGLPIECHKFRPT